MVGVKKVSGGHWECLSLQNSYNVEGCIQVDGTNCWLTASTGLRNFSIISLVA